MFFTFNSDTFCWLTPFLTSFYFFLQTNADINLDKQTATAKQGTTVSDFATGPNNPIPNSQQNQQTFGQVTAIDKNGKVVFQQKTP